tara:strand:+ start:405 stop:566 length:162 start_codon:yes stop_codon:yes gene_type:complete
MLPDEMEAEKNRKMIVALASENEILKQNIKELQEQLQKAYQKIGELNETSNSN